eukprot:TRINITY_DN8063_c0_g1_i1.p1 TRINITY_DN8063_c0_g1~~TRINITY_DN8063_c0_g1_i1.p1  ORF type:complete len:381 (-),score=169.91 TRINITY_DN8063_c0_g1_i1:121-1263(-)
MADILLCQAKSGKLTTKHLTIPRTSPVSKLIKEAESFSTAPADRLVLTYQGTILTPGTTLDTYQLAPGGLVMVAVLPAPPPVSNTQPVTMTAEEIKRFGVAFKTAFKNPNFSTVVKRLLERENMDNLAAACQGLSEDQVAQAFLTRPELLLHLLDPETLGKVAKSHPSLLEAAKNLSAAVHEEQQSAGRTAGEEAGPSGVPAGAGGSYYLDEMSDDDMEGDDGGRGPQRSRSFNAITPAQLAQALAAAAGGGGQGGVQPFQGVTGMGPQLGGAGSQLAPGATAPQSSASTPGSARITTDMFQQAIQQALMGMGPGQPQGEGAQGGAGEDGDLASKVDRMKEMGIADEGLALQALQIMGGDLQAAVDLIFSGWEGGEDSMQ